MMEQVDMKVLETFAFGRVGSNPTLHTIWRRDATGRHTRLKSVVLWVRVPQAPPYPPINRYSLIDKVF